MKLLSALKYSIEGNTVKIHLILAIVGLSADVVSGQKIDFETLPSGEIPLDQMMISDQYDQDFGVRFEIVRQNGTVVFPKLAQRGAPATAFLIRGAHPFLSTT